MLTIVDHQEVKKTLSQVKTIAIIGAKDKSGQPVNDVGRYLIQAGFTVYPVHPKRQNVWGLPTYTSILDIPDQIDLVNVFRAPKFCPDHAREVLQLKKLPLIFWLQLGIVSEESRKILQDKPVLFIQDKCLMVEHKRLFGDR
jgi:hypothetical protein